ncbi:MAG TPA: M14 family zinc carboxypeptidase [Gemmatimonadales bacterium]
MRLHPRELSAPAFRRVAAAGLGMALHLGVPAAGRAQQAMAVAPESTLTRGLEIAARYRVSAIDDRRFTHRQFWDAVAPSLRSAAFRTEEIGRSIQGREIRAVTFGTGPVRVLLWSQMHGDEATATMALADIFRFLADAGPDPLRERLRRSLTIVFVPLLNPDGAELFQRENAAGVDVNRDGRRLATPEARALKGIRDRVEPHFGFNLHDQGARTRVGRTGRQAALALLAPAYDAERSYNEVRSRARLVAATIATILAPELDGRIAKYDDTFNPRAVGDLMQTWGASTVLIESGALPDDPDKQRLRALHVPAILGALDAIATRTYESADPAAYDSLPFNTGGATDLMLRGGSLVLPGMPPVRADVALNFEDAVARRDGRVREVGDLDGAIAIDTMDVSGLYIHPRPAALERRDGGSWLRIGAPAAFDIRRGADPASELVRRLGAED